jgi:hypothetical protein
VDQGDLVAHLVPVVLEEYLERVVKRVVHFGDDGFADTKELLFTIQMILEDGDTKNHIPSNLRSLRGSSQGSSPRLASTTEHTVKVYSFVPPPSSFQIIPDNSVLNADIVVRLRRLRKGRRNREDLVGCDSYDGCEAQIATGATDQVIGCDADLRNIGLGRLRR